MPAARVSILGAGTCSPQVADLAYSIGAGLAQAGYVLVCGGLGGVMEAASQGAADQQGRIIGILPGEDPGAGNPYLTWTLITGLGHMRNYLVVLNGRVCVAIHGGSGTLSEIGLAQKINRPVIGIGTWAHLPGVTPASDAHEVLHLVDTSLQSKS